MRDKDNIPTPDEIDGMMSTLMYYEELLDSMQVPIRITRQEMSIIFEYIAYLEDQLSDREIDPQLSSI